MSLADLEVVEVMRWCDLDRAGPLLRIGVLVGDDGNAPADQRQDRCLTDQVLETMVLRMHSDRSVPEHCLRPRRGDGDHFRTIEQWIVKIVEVAVWISVQHSAKRFRI